MIRRGATGCSLLYVSPLLRELIIEAVRLKVLRFHNRQERALRDLLSAHLECATSAPIGLEMPSDARALAVAQAITRDLAARKPLARLCADVGVGIRTAQRLYRKELGIDIHSWRRQARLTRAVQLLVAGRSVKEVGVAVGYEQGTGFIEAFRRLFGVTPKAWTVSLRTNTLCVPTSSSRSNSKTHVCN